jgi:hypothetical protein
VYVRVVALWPREHLNELIPHLPTAADRRHVAPPSERMLLHEVVHRVERRGLRLCNERDGRGTREAGEDAPRA